MQVKDIMTKRVESCAADHTLDCAARIMWERDCGCVPIVDHENRVVGILTDLDICMAAYTKGLPLSAIQAGEAMSQQIFTCSPHDDIREAERQMESKQIRRIPVVDGERRLIGMVS